jgi:hypothetical protein
MAFVAVTAGGQFRAKRPHIGRTIVVTEFTIMMAVVIGAALAPVKEVEQKLAIVITLPAKSMTLAELANHLQ